MIKELARIYAFSRNLNPEFIEGYINWNIYRDYFYKHIIPSIVRMDDLYAKLFYYCVIASYNLSHYPDHIIYTILRKTFYSTFKQIYTHPNEEVELHIAVFVDKAIKRGKYRKRLRIPEIQTYPDLHFHEHENKKKIETWMKEIASSPISHLFGYAISSLTDLCFHDTQVINRWYNKK